MDSRSAGLFIENLCEFPSTSDHVRVSRAPFASSAEPFANFPTLIFGPGRSWRIPTSLPELLASPLIVRISSMCDALSPCEKLILKTSVRLTNSLIIFGSLLAGPMVQTILVLLKVKEIALPCRPWHPQESVCYQIEPAMRMPLRAL